MKKLLNKYFPLSLSVILVVASTFAYLTYKAPKAEAAISVLAHVCTGGNNLTTVTTPINTTGSSLIVVEVTSYIGVSGPSFSDNQSNTWTTLTQQSGSEPQTQFYYVASPNTNSSHTFTYSGSNSFASVCVIALSGTATSPFDQQNGAITSTSATGQPGSVTPGQANEIVITAVGYNGGGDVSSINSGFTISDHIPFSSGGYEGSGMAYLIQTSATAANPTFTLTTSVPSITAVIATFKVASSGTVLSAKSKVSAMGKIQINGKITIGQ